MYRCRSRSQECGGRVNTTGMILHENGQWCTLFNISFIAKGKGASGACYLTFHSLRRTKMQVNGHKQFQTTKGSQCGLQQTSHLLTSTSALLLGQTSSCMSTTLLIISPVLITWMILKKKQNYFAYSPPSGLDPRPKKKKRSPLTCFSFLASLCCSSAMNLSECRGTTLSSWSPVISSMAGYCPPLGSSGMLCRGEYLCKPSKVSPFSLDVWGVWLRGERERDSEWVCVCWGGGS